MIYTLVGIVDILLNIVTYIIIAQVILSWLIAFNIINLSSGPARTIVTAIDQRGRLVLASADEQGQTKNQHGART